MIKLDIAEFNNFNLKSQLYIVAEDGRLISIVRISNSDCSLHLVYDFYLLLVFDITLKKVVMLKPISLEYWNKTYKLFYLEN